MSLLTIIQGVNARLSLPVPDEIVGNDDESTVQQFYLAQEEGKALSRRGAWKALLSEHTFDATAAAAQTGGLATDLDWIVPETFYNRTLTRPVHGPLSPEKWQAIQASLSPLVDPMYRIRGTSLLISPTPTAGDDMAYEYVTNKWCQSSGGTAQTAWAADTDTAKLDEELHTLGIIWRWRRSKGLDYAQELQTYELQVRLALQREGTRPRISTEPQWLNFSADAIAGTEPNVIVTDSGDHVLWD